jgi:hypothetical protein
MALRQAGFTGSTVSSEHEHETRFVAPPYCGGMKTLLRVITLAALVTALPSSALAQEDTKLGVVMATPSSVSIVWHASDRVAIRPEIGVSASSSTAESPAGDAKATQWTLSPGFSVLFYTARLDALRTYVAPRYVYSRAHNESTSPFGETGESTGTSHSVSGSFGAEYGLHRRFAVFGELGINYTHAESEFISSNGWNHRTAVGAIFHF